jgi:hypothetical protein
VGVRKLDASHTHGRYHFGISELVPTWRPHYGESLLRRSTSTPDLDAAAITIDIACRRADTTGNRRRGGRARNFSVAQCSGPTILV